jgi:hypothetical protein
MLRQVLHRAVAWGMIDVNPAKVGVELGPPTQGAASARVMGGTRGSFAGDRAAVRADGPVRGCDRATAGGVDRP